MKKTSIYLDPSVDHRLAHLASAKGITKAEYIRRSLAAVVESAPRARPSAWGVFDGPGDLSANVDKYLAETGFGAD